MRAPPSRSPRCGRRARRRCCRARLPLAPRPASGRARAGGPEPAAVLVAVQARVALRHQRRASVVLPAAGMPITSTTSPGARAARRRREATRSRRPAGKCASRRRGPSSVRASAGTRPAKRHSTRVGARQRQTHGTGRPARRGDLERRRAEARGDRGQDRSCSTLPRRGASQRPMGEQPDAVRGAVRRRRRCGGSRRANRLSSTCTAAISRHAGAASICPTVTLQRPMPRQARALERGERAHAGRERRARIGRVQLVEVDALDAEGATAGLAGGAQVRARPSGTHDRPAASGRPWWRRGSRSVARPGRERAGDQPLVVAGCVASRQ